MPDLKNESTTSNRRFGADSLVKLVLIWSLAISLVALDFAIIIRAVLRDDIDSNIMLEIFDSYLALFGVVVGYVLGRERTP